MKSRLDTEMVRRTLVATRSQAESWIELGRVYVGGRQITKSGFFVTSDIEIELRTNEQYVSRAGLKLASVAQLFHLDFTHTTVLDVGSSTGGFTDYALQHGATKVIAVDVGTDQMYSSLRDDSRIELHEKTDIRDFMTNQPIDIVVIDVSFISLRQILPSVARLVASSTQIVAMVKPQFEASRIQLTKTGIIKNDTVRRTVLRDFELWSKRDFRIITKADSAVAGAHGNQERFYLLQKN